jgi:hypothetical protein
VVCSAQKSSPLDTHTQVFYNEQASQESISSSVAPQPALSYLHGRFIHTLDEGLK